MLLQKLLQLHENVKLQLIGEGELRPQMEELVKSLKIKNKVVFLGLQANVYPFLHDADTFCLPSKYEGIPMTLIEMPWEQGCLLFPVRLVEFLICLQTNKMHYWFHQM